MHCNICGKALGEPRYTSAGAVSVTSLCELLPIRTSVFFCGYCGHLQTPPLAEIESYYSTDYKILIESEEEDQLYKIEADAAGGDRRVYRFDHQADTLLRKIEIPAAGRILDYGCAKGSTLKRLTARRPDVVPHLFDVSDMYVPFWRAFTREENTAIREVPSYWCGTFDVVTSFFSLEHVVEPNGMMRQVYRLLKPGGSFYGIVPNVYSNVADFVVVDHISHFSAASLWTLLSNCGFTEIQIDDDAHTGAWVVHAIREESQPQVDSPHAIDTSVIAQRVVEMANYWISFADRVREFERSRAASRAVIYGSGFYGTFIATCLNNFEAIRSFLDRNPFRQGKNLLGKPILDPENTPREIDVCYVGLNPTRARAEIAKMTSWTRLPMVFFYP